MHELLAPNPRLEIMAKRIKAKTTLIERLLAGELNLFETAAYFRLVNASPTEYPDISYRMMSGGCENEKRCRQVLSWVAGYLLNRGAQSESEARIAVLEAQLTAHIAIHGRVILPEL